MAPVTADNRRRTRAGNLINSPAGAVAAGERAAYPRDRLVRSPDHLSQVTRRTR
ncbi:MAG TPA: hypothetical protein VEL73_04750 [Mycobacteriales bacterium]|nr:hypothetical protein [Mycobacteriales bacterium]